MAFPCPEELQLRSKEFINTQDQAPRFGSKKHVSKKVSRYKVATHATTKSTTSMAQTEATQLLFANANNAGTFHPPK